MARWQVPEQTETALPSSCGDAIRRLEERSDKAKQTVNEYTDMQAQLEQEPLDISSSDR